MIIPEELVALAGERRIIPFLGAGFSDALGLPAWDEMLKGLCGRIEGALSFDELKEATGGDYLQIAEYLYLKSDKRIGPLRRHIDRALTPNAPLLRSGPHVELVNLGSQQIYTTNYDDLVENTYRDLGLPVDVIVLPKDIALANPKKTQIVKYHGDLEHEETLVLTESAYYRRLDFDSPMDLKFRSDLLGKSVLFMGYSFRDINIRIIWFKMMDMMRDIPEADRRPSYIVRLNANEALEDLYAAVGIRTIVLSPDKPVLDAQERSSLLGKFVLELSLQAGAAPVSAEDAHERGRVVVSSSFLAEPYLEPRAGGKFSIDDFLHYGGYLPLEHPRAKRLLEGCIPEPLRSDHAQAMTDALPRLILEKPEDYVSVVAASPPSANLTAIVVRVLASQEDRPPRKLRQGLIKALQDWPKVWSSKLPASYARDVLEHVESEFIFQARRGADEDTAYLADLGARLANGSLTDDPDIQAEAGELLKSADVLYPSVVAYEPDLEGPPKLDAIMAEIKQRKKDFRPVPWVTPKGQKAQATRVVKLQRRAKATGDAGPQAGATVKREQGSNHRSPDAENQQGDAPERVAPGEARRSRLEEPT